MSIKISELPVASSVNSADIVPIVQDGTTKQARAEMIKPQIETVINSSSTNDKPVGAKAVYDYSAPKKHDSETQEYGVATTTKYGHTKIIDNLDSSSYQVGESLSAYQGAVLKQSIDSINDDIENISDELAKKQTTSNMTNTLDENSTKTQYPNAQVTFEKYKELLNQIPTNEDLGNPVSGNPINVQDSSNLPLKDFALGGNATQGADPTPDSPQDIHVVTGDNTVNIYGGNLLNEAYLKTATYSEGTYKYTTVDLPENITLYCKASLKTGKTAISGLYVFITDNGTNPNASGAVNCQLLSNGSVWSESNKIFNRNRGIYFNFYPKTANIENILDTYNFEVSIVANAPYEEYKGTQTQLLSLGTIELAKIGTYQDRIYKSGGKWWLEKNIGKVTLNGSESNWYNEGGGAPYSLSIPGSIIATSNNTPPFVLCNYFQPIQYSATWTNYNSLITTNSASSGATNKIKIRYTDVADMDTFKTWLSTHNTTVYYVLATPTTTEITDNTLLGQLENILKMHTNKNVTNFSIVPTGTNAEPTGEWEYRVDLGTVIGNINNAIISLGGNV